MVSPQYDLPCPLNLNHRQRYHLTKLIFYSPLQNTKKIFFHLFTLVSVSCPSIERVSLKSESQAEGEHLMQHLMAVWDTTFHTGVPGFPLSPHYSFQFSFLLMNTLRGISWWLGYSSPCYPYGTPKLNSRLLDSVWTSAIQAFGE